MPALGEYPRSLQTEYDPTHSCVEILLPKVKGWGIWGLTGSQGRALLREVSVLRTGSRSITNGLV